MPSCHVTFRTVVARGRPPPPPRAPAGGAAPRPLPPAPRPPRRGGGAPAPRSEDVAAAADAGADLAGFVLAESPRRAAAPLPEPETMLSVGVFVGEQEEAGTDLAQLYPEVNGHRGREGMLLRGGETVARVLDLPWEGEDPAHWERAAAVEGRILLAGGLGPDNVRAAVEAVRPWCVDASRSLETSPGIKDHARVRAFVEAAR
jgi:hypothetical protein